MRLLHLLKPPYPADLLDGGESVPIAYSFPDWVSSEAVAMFTHWAMREAWVSQRFIANPANWRDRDALKYHAGRRDALLQAIKHLRQSVEDYGSDYPHVDVPHFLDRRSPKVGDAA